MNGVNVIAVADITEIPPPTDHDEPPTYAEVRPMRRATNGHRVPPHDLNAEESLLGACLITKNDGVNAYPSPAINKAVEAGVTRADFYKPAHGHIFDAIITLADKGEAPDPVTVAHQLHRDGLLDDIGGAATLVQLQSGTPSISNAGGYADIVVTYARRRHLIGLGPAVQEAGYDLASDVDAAEAKVAELVASSMRRNTSTIELTVDMERILNGETIGEPPTLAWRDDGVTALFYAGKLNNIFGESESGKSLLAQWWCVQEMQKGNTVLYVDFEKDAKSVAERMMQMGATYDDLVDRFAYIKREDPWTPAEIVALRRLTEERTPTLCIIDGVTDAMRLDGLNPLDNSDIAKFYAGIPLILTKHGAGALAVDHITKDFLDNKAKGSIGGQHKRAGITGASIRLTMKEAAGRGRTGTGLLYVDKDAPGHIRQYAVDGKWIADVTMRSDGQTLVMQVDPSSMKEKGTTRPSGAPRYTVYMERVSRVLEAFGDVGQSGRAVCRETTGDDKFIYSALGTLVEEGYVRQELKGTTRLHWSTKAYRQSMDKTVDPGELVTDEVDVFGAEPEDDGFVEAELFDDEEPF